MCVSGVQVISNVELINIQDPGQGTEPGIYKTVENGQAFSSIAQSSVYGKKESIF